jgi:hypothetical protein
MILVFVRPSEDRCTHLTRTFELYSLRSDDPEAIAIRCNRCKRDVVFSRERESGKLAAAAYPANPASK